ncbi:MAG: GMC family oxidoreductase [Actinobacteria bacterium]|nr:GMC family oxidoreductase [Actinomycetota bacterium]
MRNDRVAAVLASAARGILGDGYTPEIPARMLEAIDHVATQKERNQLLTTLRLLDTKAGALALTGRPVPMSWLTMPEAEAVIQKWTTARLAGQRRLAGSLTAIALVAKYGEPCPEWQEFGYAGPLGPPPERGPRIESTVIDSDETISCDVVVVGSGAGGGCAAAVLANAGLDVVILEKGGHFAERDFHHIERRALHEMYLYGATLTNTDVTTRIIAGKCLGGGTLVNFAVAFKTPDYVLREWAEVSGIDAFVSGEIEQSLDEVAERIGITTEQSAPGRRDQLLEQGAAKLGWHNDALPRAVRGCTQDAGCGYCGFGCRAGAKQGTALTYLVDAAEAGARIFVETDVRRVAIENGVAVGVEAVCGRHNLRVRARAVVAAAGSVETPALLLRSGLRGEVGKHLRLHPGTAAWGFFDEDVKIWEGTTMARYSKELAHIDGGYGPIFETIPLHPGTWATVFPWYSAADHRDLMSKIGRVSFVAALARDAAGGRVTIDKHGAPRIDWKPTIEDNRRITEGVVAAGRIIEAAGATEIHTVHTEPISYRPAPGAHERWADEVRERGFLKDATFGSWHQMGSCRMGIDPATSAVGAENESHEVKNLYVMDASTFPTASGVNPMVSIYGIAHRGAKKLAERLS